jgi:excisionase family DNA binding protein
MPDILTIEEVATMLRLSKRSIYELVSKRGKERFSHNPLPVLRIGDRVLFVREDVLAWINRQKEAA